MSRISGLTRRSSSPSLLGSLQIRGFDFSKPSRELVSKGRKRPGEKTALALTKQQKAEIARCAADITYWVNTYVRTYDPRLLPDNPIIPFHLYPKQEEFLRWLQERENERKDGLAETSRDVGFTWLCGAYALHGWLFRTGFSAGFGSRKLELIDKLGDPDSIFEKIRIALRALPEWMLPAGFKWKEHDNFARLLNPTTGATITGEGGDDIGRGGRKTVYFIDEAAFLAHPDQAERALSQTTKVRIWVSTPNGPGNPFHKKRFGGKIAVFTFHWKEDPRKNHYEIRAATGAIVATGQGYAPPPPEGGSVVYPWYEGEKERLDDPVTVAQEIDIDYTASIEGICIPALWVAAAVGLELPESGEEVAGLDIAEEGKDKTIFIPRRGPVVRTPRRIPNGNTTQTAWKARDTGREARVSRLFYDADGPGMGVKGTWASSAEPLGFEAVPVHWGAPASEDKWPDGKLSKEKFLNLRAELWWKLRVRFEKAYEYRVLGVQHPPDEMISIPNDPALIADLSLPLIGSSDTGKKVLESKKAMKKRGVKSPDYGDALAYSFAPYQPPREIWAV